MEMAQEAGLIGKPIYKDGLEAFAKLVRADEREACAKWYASEGHMMFPVAIPDAIRSNT